MAKKKTYQILEVNGRYHRVPASKTIHTRHKVHTGKTIKQLRDEQKPK